MHQTCHVVIEHRGADPAEGQWLSVRAPAKLNLGLAVTGRRPDGYHELRSVFVRVDLADRLLGSVEAVLSADRLRIHGADELDPAQDIVLRAVDRLRREVGHDAPPLDLVLNKAVPIGAGLGGGSSDAAAALALAAHLWSWQGSAAQMDRLSAELGADVPFFARRLRAAAISGTGNVIESLPSVRGGAGALLVTPAARLSTREVFAAFDASGPASTRAIPAIEALEDAFRSGLDGEALSRWAASGRDANDLWPAALALEPTLGVLRERLESALGRPVLLTGSGSSLFALYPSSVSAEEARTALRADHPEAIEDCRLVRAVEVDAADPMRRDR
jgi:4-diphosphocytidyl-2-C-methyl-D-erythritol kinase